MDRAFERKYSIPLSKLKPGLHDMDFEIDNDFFSHFEYSPVHEGEVKVKAKIHKYETHLDVKFGLAGFIKLACDRCTELYRHSFHTDRRVVFTYDAKMKTDDIDVVVIDRNDPWISLSGELYEFIALEVPIRKIAPPSEHQCAPEVLSLIGALPDEDEDEDEDELDEEDLDDLDEVDEEADVEDDIVEEEEVKEWEDEDWKEEKDEDDDFEDDDIEDDEEVEDTW